MILLGRGRELILGLTKITRFATSALLPNLIKNLKSFDDVFMVQAQSQAMTGGGL